MKKIFDIRKTELEIAAKNTMVEIHIIKGKADEVANMLEMKERHLLDIDAALRELSHLATVIEKEEKEEDKNLG